MKHTNHANLPLQMRGVKNKIDTTWRKYIFLMLLVAQLKTVHLWSIWRSHQWCTKEKKRKRLSNHCYSSVRTKKKKRKTKNLCSSRKLRSATFTLHPLYLGQDFTGTEANPGFNRRYYSTQKTSQKRGSTDSRLKTWMHPWGRGGRIKFTEHNLTVLMDSVK